MEALRDALDAEASGVPPLGDIDRAINEVTTSRRRWAGVIGVAATVVVLLTTMVGPGWQPVAVEPAAPPPTAPQPGPTTPSEQWWPDVPEEWLGPLRGRGTLVQRMQVAGEVRSWQDPLDAKVGWVDVERVTIGIGGSQPLWGIELAANPPPAAGLAPGLTIAYGLVLDTDADGAADFLVGIDNDAPEQGDFHVWVTNLGTGETDEQIGPPYGYPIEFAHPDEHRPDDPEGPPTMRFTFLGISGPADLDGRTVRFYAWTSAARDGRVVAYDYAPNSGWITTDTP